LEKTAYYVEANMALYCGDIHSENCMKCTKSGGKIHCFPTGSSLVVYFVVVSEFLMTWKCMNSRNHSG